MISITSFLHRDVLKNLIRRWMYNQPSPGDADALNRLVHFNTAYVSRYLPVFADLIFRQVPTGGPISARVSRSKADLKDAIVVNCPLRNARIEQLISGYRADPGLFYRETPFHGALYFAESSEGRPRVIGSSRIKRVRRLAEKIARRIIDALFESIRHHADRLAFDRAVSIGLAKEALITPRDQMVEEFQKAESRLLMDLRQGHPIRMPDDMVIQDVAGMKVIIEDGFRDEFLSRLRNLAHCDLIEVEEHRGRYNAVNLIVRYRPDREALIAHPPGERLRRRMQAGGMPFADIHDQFKAFVLDAEEDVHIEVIVCNYQEMLESEIGRCMHEDRIMQQRLSQQYTGPLARNIEFLMAYMFAFAASSRTEIGALPIRLWERYLPDYFEEVLMGLFDAPRLEIFE
jgi:hypothetical protein